jgi:hypothetical protein
MSNVTGVQVTNNAAPLRATRRRTTVKKMGVTKRGADVPKSARRLPVSKADLLEVAWSFAAIAHDHGCDDDGATLARLVEELNVYRERRGARRLVPSAT